MEAKNESAGAGDVVPPEAALFNEVALAVWEDALRFAFDAEGAPRRCGRRACRSEDRCMFRWVESKRLDCGGGFSFDAITLAATATMFAVRLMTSLPGVPHGRKSPQPRLADDDAASAPARP